MLMSPENVSENFGESRHCKNLKFENFDESQLKSLGDMGWSTILIPVVITYWLIIIIPYYISLCIPKPSNCKCPFVYVCYFFEVGKEIFQIICGMYICSRLILERCINVLICEFVSSVRISACVYELLSVMTCCCIYLQARFT